MRIGFVAEPYEERNASGMGYVVLELMRNLPLQGQKHEFVYYSSRPIDRTLVPNVQFENALIPKGFLKQWWWFFRYKGDAEALVYMVPLLPLVIPRRVKAVPMCQELGSQKTNPGRGKSALIAFVRDRLLMPISLRRAAHVISASQATKDDIMQYYRVSNEKITVVPDGYQDLKRFAATASLSAEGAKPFFFFAGKVKHRKNVHGIVSGFILFKKRTNAEVELVIAGDYGGGYYDSLVADIERSGLTREVRFVGYVNNEELYAYYKKALACVYPSFNEGFGMPILEAMSLGTPVITSNQSSMPEVGGDAAILIDPHSPEAISVGMERLYIDRALREQCIERGFVQAARFSWTRSAREYLDVLELLQ